ncbi:hypothetical protein M0D21_13565 [Aquimarina sp. D1M17]|uniref:zinc ribbon domain-containing protein n=1 Tax=Aquimarina acroporae TaxID=2937283 RepID=UPI0020BDCA98|nr:zinc ribbon domain-containing protein [Aquimarina acroporae]MCK8522607.1 hypothetical protein [Aquimarina acroporae]
MEDLIQRETLCSQCNTPINGKTKFCANCGYPENGTEKEQSVYHANKVMKKNQVKEDQNRIKSGRNTLYWIAGISFFFGLITFLLNDDSTTFIVQIILAIIYLILAYWSQKKPFAALLSALLLYVLLIAADVVVEPASIFRGIIVKIIIISFLIKGVNSALQNSKKE